MKSDFLSGDRLKVLIVVILGTFMAAMDSSIVNVSIPSLMTFFHASVEDVEWVITSYMLGFAVFMPLTGWFRDRIGNKNLYLWSLGIFTVGSLLCGIAWNLPTLVIARLIQSFGGGAIMPTSMAIIGEHFKQHERGKVLGYWGVGVVIGPAIGPTIGGILTEYFGWRSIFLINLPIGIFAILYSLKVIKRDLPHLLSKNPFDHWGFISFGSFLTLFLLAISFAERVGFSSLWIILSLFISLIFFALFVLIEMKVKNPLLDFQLFKNSDFTKCILITCVRSVGLFGSVFLMPVFFQHVLLKSETETGMLLFPSSVLLALTMPFAGHLNDKYGPRLLSVAGLVLLSSFMFFYCNLWPGMNSFELIWPTLFRGLGLGLLVAPITATTINAVPKIKIAMASTMSSIVQQTSASIGIAILAFIVSNTAWGQLDGVADSRRKDYNNLRKSKYSLLPHRNTFLLPFVYNWMPNEQIYQAVKNVEPGNSNKRFYKNTEAEFQISFAVPIVRDLNERDWDVMFAYTHHSWWQIYNSAWSRPFRETNYMPELFTRYVYSSPKMIFGLPLEAIDFGYIHQSNGQIQALSRSWDRLFFRSFIRIKDFAVLLTGWYRLPEKSDEDDNPDIYNFMGVGDLEIIKKIGVHHFHLKTPLFSHHYSVDLKYSYPLQDGLRWYLSFQSGYGHSLIEYNHNIQRAGIGFTLENFLY